MIQQPVRFIRDRVQLEHLRLQFEMRALDAEDAAGELAIDRVVVEMVGEFARIVASYCVRVSASEIRMATCGRHIWVRLLRPAGHPLDLLLRSPAESASPACQPEPAIVPAV